jgi:hypothetical protein
MNVTLIQRAESFRAENLAVLGPTCSVPSTRVFLNLIMNEILVLREQADVYCNTGERKMKMGCSMGGRGWKKGE